MDVRRIIIVAGMLGLAAVLFIFVRGGLNSAAPAPAAPVVAAPIVQEIEYKDVLVAQQDVAFGHRMVLEDFKWNQWPEENLPKGDGPVYITSDARPSAIEELIGTVAQAPIFSGEPILDRKLIKTGDRSVMSALLAPGMRAVTTRISVASAAGGFIKPGDRVDIILTRELKDFGGTDTYSVSDTIFENVRVMAIDQNFAVGADGAASVLGSTATFELAQDDAEYLQEAVNQGDLALTLRSLNSVGGKVIRRPEGIKRDNAASATIAVYRAGQAQQVGLRSE